MSNDYIDGWIDDLIDNVTRFSVAELSDKDDDRGAGNYIEEDCGSDLFRHGPYEPDHIPSEIYRLQRETVQELLTRCPLLSDKGADDV